MNVWSKMISKYFRIEGKEISFESIKWYLPPDNSAELTKYTVVPKKDQLFTISPGKKRNLHDWSMQQQCIFRLMLQFAILYSISLFKIIWCSNYSFRLAYLNNKYKAKAYQIAITV